MSISSINRMHPPQSSAPRSQEAEKPLEKQGSAAAVDVRISEFARGLSSSGSALFSALSDETKKMIGTLISSGGMSQDTALNAINYFAKLRDNRAVDDANGQVPDTAGPGLDALLAGFEKGGGLDIDALRQASAEHRQRTLESLNRSLAAGKQGYSLEELSAGAEARQSGLGTLIARDAEIDLSKGAL